MKSVNHKIVRALIAVLVASNLALPSQANDAAIEGIGGTPTLLRGEHRSMVMQSEKVRIVLGDDRFYDTRVDFVFRNEGGATKVQMGFPESHQNDRESVRKSAFLRFATWVDGRKTPARRTIFTSKQGDLSVYHVKTVAFARHQTRRVRVEYRASPTYRAAIYAFTGQNWKGNVERSDLEVRIPRAGLWIGSPLWNEEPLAMKLEVRPHEAVFHKTWRNWQAQGMFWFALTPTVPHAMWDEIPNTETLNPNIFAAATKIFRVGAVTSGLPQKAEAPPALMRNGVAYIRLNHLSMRLGDFSADLERHRKIAPQVDVNGDDKTDVWKLVAGRKTLHFAPGVGTPAPIALPQDFGPEYGPELYVPLARVAKTLGLSFKVDPRRRRFELKRGTWTGQ